MKLLSYPYTTTSVMTRSHVKRGVFSGTNRVRGLNQTTLQR